MSASFAPNPSLHASAEIERRCPYCHPELSAASGARAAVEREQHAKALLQQAEVQRQYSRFLSGFGGACTTGVD